MEPSIRKGGKIMWLSECCGDEPNYMFELGGDSHIGVSGICSSCGDHASFKDYDEDDD